MKKTILTAAILSVFLIGCKDNKSTNSETSVETEMVHEHEAEADHDGDHDGMALNNAWVNEIQLDNGSKWDANLETTQGVETMLQELETSNPETVADYHQLASKLNDEKNTVVKKCTMVGPSHDNLHVFLHPLIDKIAALGKVTSVDEGSEITVSIKENLDAYYDYFK
ncbi:MAG TPA: hypothetical protein VKX40_07295 [Aequorivita sp.]|nr:hypothetical protein [Aequorivita sp.]